MDVERLKKENEELKQELGELKNTSLIKKLNESLKRIAEGKFLTRAQLGM